MFGREGKKDHQNTHHIHYKKELSETKDLVKSLSARIEKLEAKDTANAELRKLTSAKNDKLREDIGELHELFREIEEQRQDFDVKISETQSLVKMVDPKSLLKDSQRFKSKYSMLQGKFDLLSRKFSKFENRFSSFESKLRVFKGHEELLKMENSTKNKFKEIQKISNTANSHATKLENHYIKINKTVNSAKEISEEMTELRKHLEGLDIDTKIATFDNLVENTKSTFSEMKLSENNEVESNSEVEELAELVVESFEQLKSEQAKMKKLIEPYNLKQLQDWVGLLANFMSNDDAFRKYVSKIIQKSRKQK